MSRISRTWKFAAAFGLAGMLVAGSDGPAEAGWRKRDVIIVQPSYVAAAPAATVVAPATAVYAAPVRAVYAAPVIETRTVIGAAPAAFAPATVVEAPVPATYLAPATVIRRVAPAKVIFPRRVYRVWP
jgi:hypothetical protein